jgi:hypothetical protein
MIILCRQQLKQKHKEDIDKMSLKIQTLTERNLQLSSSLIELQEVQGKNTRQLEELKTERIYLTERVETQQNILDFRENGNFLSRESAAQSADMKALEEVMPIVKTLTAFYILVRLTRSCMENWKLCGLKETMH